MARFTAGFGGVLLLIFFGISSASARMYYLPDYQNGMFSKRVNENSQGDKTVFSPDPRSCDDYFGFLSAGSKGNMDCGIVKYFPQIGNCYANCSCNRTTYPYNSSNCSFELVGGSCTDTYGNSYYKECIDPCASVTGKDCGGLLCKETFEAEGCERECKECYLSACDYPENANYPLKETCKYGCDTTGTVQGCNTKCYVCSSCEPKDCSGYGLDSCPDNADCESCDIGCGQGTKYKIKNCDSGYYQNGNSCVECDYNGHDLPSCPYDNICTKESCGGITKHKIAQCTRGEYDEDYFICGNQLCTWGAF